jgi:hypothetical protein
MAEQINKDICNEKKIKKVVLDSHNGIPVKIEESRCTDVVRSTPYTRSSTVPTEPTPRSRFA